MPTENSLNSAVPLRDVLPRAVGVMEEGIVRQLHRGVQVYVSRQGRVIADDAVGEARPREALTREHLMLLLSAGKPFAAVAVAQLWERGLLGFDDLVAKHLPEFAAGGKERITIRHLLTHTGGFRNVDTGWPLAAWDESIRRICESTIEPNWIPGQRAGYHVASSWFILGELIRRLHGRPFDVYLREAICDPLGLGDLWNGMPADCAGKYGERLAPMFVSENGGELRSWEYGDSTFATLCAPGGNTRGTARDLGRFYEALLDGRHSVLRPETIAELTRPQRVGMFDETFQHVIDFGLGVILNSRKYGPVTVPYGYGPVASDRAFGHGGSQSSIAFADPQRDLVVVIVCNGRPGEGRHQRRMRQILEALEGDLNNRTESL